MEWASTSGQTAESIEACTKTISCMVLVSSPGRMDEGIVGSMFTTSRMDKVHLNGQMVGDILALGPMESNMVRVDILIGMEMKEKALGKMVRKSTG